MDDLSADEIREHRGTLTEPGQEQPLARSRRSRRTSTCSSACAQGEFPDGARVLRAKIDMASPQHQPARPRDVPHPPRHPSAHGRRVVHLPDLRLRARPVGRHRGHHPLASARSSSRTTGRSTTGSSRTCPCPRGRARYEFARLNLTYTVLSKRFLLRLVNEGRVRGWDDPRMPTISGIRRRGFPPEALREFAEHDRRGQARERRRVRGARALRARRPEPHGAAAHGGAAAAQGRHHELPRGPGRGVRRSSTTRRTRRRARARCRSRASCGSSATTSWRTRRRSSSASPPAARCACARAYFVTCQEVVKDAAGEVVELRCTYDPATRGGSAPDGRSPKATLHWVSAAPRACRPRCASTTTSSRGPTRARRATCSPT